jgi:hypothetical protein
MLMHADADGDTALGLAASEGHVDAMRVLLDHPSADAAAMLAFRTPGGASALTVTASFAACSSPGNSSCEPLLLLLRRVAADPHPSDAQHAHMTKVMEALCQDVLVEDEGEEEGEEDEERVRSVFDDDQPDASRDECVHLLLEHGADAVCATSPVMKRIIRECFALARVPQRINEAVVGIAIARGHETQRHNAA